jgi:hypothetical protein
LIIGRFYQAPICFFAVPLQCQNQSTETMSKKEQHNDAKRFSLEYLQYLLRQEDIIERLLDKRMIQLEPELEKLIDEKIDSRIRTFLNNK